MAGEVLISKESLSNQCPIMGEVFTSHKGSFSSYTSAIIRGPMEGVDKYCVKARLAALSNATTTIKITFSLKVLR